MNIDSETSHNPASEPCLRFFARIRARSSRWKPQAPPAGSPFVEVLVHDGPESREEAAWHATFDGVLSALEAIPRCFIEPDGAFVWNGPVSEDRLAWQLDGNLYDLGPSLAYVEVRGRCPRFILEQLMGVLGRPATPLLFELPEVGAVVGEAEFLRWAEGNEAGT